MQEERPVIELNVRVSFAKEWQRFGSDASSQQMAVEEAIRLADLHADGTDVNVEGRIVGDGRMRRLAVFWI